MAAESAEPCSVEEPNAAAENSGTANAPNVQAVALPDAASTWAQAGGPPFGICAHCFEGLERPIVLACGHAVCASHWASEGTPCCRWAPACAECSFPRGCTCGTPSEGASAAPVAAGVLEALLARGVRAPGTPTVAPAVSSSPSTAAAAQVVAARSPLEALEGYEALATACSEDGTPSALGVKAAALLRVVRLRELFEVPAPAMASRYDQFRLGAGLSRASGAARGACPEDLRETAEAAAARAREQSVDLEAALRELPEPSAKSALATPSPPASAFTQELRGVVECPVCYTALHEPITIACGHTYCKRCLARQLDFERDCALCRGELAGFIDCYAVTAGLGAAVEAVAPGAVEQGRQLAEKEAEDMRDWRPIFVCSLVCPTQECPLHIFEPRYRLMMRRAVSSGQRRFGMCAPVGGPPEISQNGFSKVGTMLFIREIRMLPDGRSLVDCVGERRFKVKECSERDGYNVARVEDLCDEEALPAGLAPACRATHAELLQLMGRVAQPAPATQQSLATAGDEDFFWQALSALPVSDGVKFRALIMEGQAKRFEFLKDVMSHVVGLLGALADRREGREHADDDDVEE